MEFYSAPPAKAYTVRIAAEGYPVRRILLELKEKGQTTFRADLWGYGSPPQYGENSPSLGTSMMFGRVLDADEGFPVLDTTIRIWSPSRRVTRSIRVDLDGRFVCEGLPGDTEYFLDCTAAGYNPTPPMRLYLSPLEKVEVRVSYVVGAVNYVSFPGQALRDRSLSGGRAVVSPNMVTGEPVPHFQ